MTKRLMMIAATMLAAMVAGACGGSAFEGIYEVQAWSENTAGCDSPGVSVLEQQNQTMFYIKEEKFFGSKFLNVKFCDDLADCRSLAGDGETIHIGEYTFEKGDDSGWTYRWYSGFAFSGEMCNGDVVETRLRPAEGGGITIEQTRTAVPEFPPTGSDDDCEDSTAFELAEGQPCTELELIAATSVAELP